CGARRARRRVAAAPLLPCEGRGPARTGTSLGSCLRRSTVMMNEAVKNQELRDKIAQDYEWGFSSDIEQEFAPKGLSEDTVRFISAKKNEPEWMLDWRLKAFRIWQEMELPQWAKLQIPHIDYQDAYYYAEPKAKKTIGSLDELDPEILRVYEKLGIPI